MTQSISPAGLSLVQEFEGFRAEPAELSDGNWVVGFGHIRVGEAGAPVSEAEAASLLDMDIAPIEAAINAQVKVALTQSQFDALVSFVMSIGVDAFARSQVLRRINAGAHVAAAGAMDAWRKLEIEGELVVVDALVRRRAAEKALFLKDAPHAAAPAMVMRAKLDYAAQVLGAPVDYAPTPALNAARVAQSDIVVSPPMRETIENIVVCPAQRLTEILLSEPATEALLLTQVVTEEQEEQDDELITAHAKPAARRIAMPGRDRRISKMRNRLGFVESMKRVFGRPVEAFGLSALLVFGLALTLVGGSMLYASNGDMIEMAGAGAFAAPGLAATLMAGFGFFRAPEPQPVAI